MPTIHLTDGQARALLEHGQHGAQPKSLGGKARRALDRAVAKLKNAVDDIEYGEFKADLRELTEVLLDARRRPFVDVVHRRLRDLLVLSKLWTAAEQIPGVSAALLNVERLDDPLWPSDVLNLLDQHGIEIDLPGDDLGDGEDAENGR